MPKFEVTSPDGKRFEIEAPDAQSASDTLDEYLSTQGGERPGNVPSSEAFDAALAAGSKASQMFAKSAEPNLLDRGQSFAQGVIEGLPVVGPGLANARVELDALIAQVPGGMTPDEVRARAMERKAFLQEKAGNERLAGQITGAVAPLTLAGLSAPATIGRALGMTGGLGSQIAAGTLSGGAISGADTLARGGSMQDAGTNALIGGAAGGVAPVVFKGAGAAWNALTGKGASGAVKNVATALSEDNIKAPEIARMMAQMGPDTMLMDLGPNLQTLAGGIAANRGPAQKVLRTAISDRGENAGARVAGDVARTIGNGQEVGALTESIIAAQKAAADPLYAAVRDVPVPFEGNIKFVAQTPLGRSAFEKAAQLAANDGKNGQGLTVGFLDYAKQALDDVAGAAKRAGENNASRQASQMARILAGEVDKLVPEYKAARNAFAGPAAVLDAIEAGRGTFKGDLSPADMTRLMADMTASEKDAFLQGAQTAVADLIGNSANDVAAVRNLLRKPYNQAKLSALIGKEATDDLLRSIDRELMFGQTANVVAKNSETARRTMAANMVNPDQTDLGPQGYVGLVFAAINGARAKLRSAMQPKINSEMAQLLTSKTPSQQDIARLMAGQQPASPLPIAPAVLPLLPGVPGNNRPLRIVVNGAGSYSG